MVGQGLFRYKCVQLWEALLQVLSCAFKEWVNLGIISASDTVYMRLLAIRYHEEVTLCPVTVAFGLIMCLLKLPCIGEIVVSLGLYCYQCLSIQSIKLRVECSMINCQG